jgi:hypothetical protein
MEVTIAPNNIEETISPLSVVLMYENRDAQARGLNLYAHLVVEVGKDIPIEFSWWAMAALESPQHATAARDAVLLADMVIVAAHPAADWPQAFKTWIDSWKFPKQKQLSAIGGLFLPSVAGFNVMSGRQVYLQYVAAKLELDFLTAPAESTVEHLKAKLGLASTMNPLPYEAYSGLDRPAFSPYSGING